MTLNKKRIVSITGVTMIFCGLFLFGLWYLQQPRPKVSPSEYLRTRAATEVHTVSIAIRLFENKYGSLPIVDNVTNQVDQDNSDLVKILCADTNFLVCRALNPERIEFLPDTYLRNPSLLDPWGKPLHVVLTSSKANLRIGGADIQYHYAVWSDGPNVRNDYGNDDDVASWK